MKNTVIGFVGALVLIASVFYGPKLWHFAKAVHELSQIIAIDQKTGSQYSVADVLTEIAAERVQQKIAQQAAVNTNAPGNPQVPGPTK